jgi:adenylate cyclase
MEKRPLATRNPYLRFGRQQCSDFGHWALAIDPRFPVCCGQCSRHKVSLLIVWYANTRIKVLAERMTLMTRSVLPPLGTIALNDTNSHQDMPSEIVQRRLAAIFAADVVGFSRLMGAEEEATLAQLKALRAEVIDPTIAAHQGRIFKTTGDGLLAEFASVVAAVQCAAKIQTEMASRGAAQLPERRVVFRIGVNLGDIIIDGDDVFGDGVNLAARIEGQSDPGGICISRAAHEQVKNKLDLVFEDMGERQLKNIAQPVQLYRVAGLGSPVPAKVEAPPLVTDRPSIAVLPFSNLSGDKNLDLLIDCLAEDVITLLARVAGFFVIARSSSFAYKGGSPDVRAVGRELGVRYVVDGSVRAAGPSLRVTTQLTEAETGKHIWAGRFDVPRAETLELQDDIARGIMVELEPELTRAELAVIQRQRPENMGAWSSYRQAFGAISIKGWSEETVADAIRHLRRAIELDPEFALAHGMLALLTAIAVNTGLIESEDDARANAKLSAERAAQLDNASSEVLGYAGCALSDLGERARGIELLEQAIETDPSNAQARVALGAGQILNGQRELGIENMRQGMRLSPRDVRLGFWGAFLAETLAHSGQLDAALDAARTACRRDNKLYAARVVAAIVLNRLKRSDEAYASLAEAKRIRPRLSLNQIERTHGRRAAAELRPIWEALEANSAE